jgi:hypothetical protein
MGVGESELVNGALMNGDAEKLEAIPIAAFGQVAANFQGREGGA